MTIHGMINYSTFICPFEYGECRKKEKFKKFEYLEKENSFLDEINDACFMVFEGLPFGKK